MKHWARIISFVLVMCMLAGSFCFAAAPKASIVSPAADTVVSGDSLLISVKVADKNSVKVTVFEEFETVTDATTSQASLKSVNPSNITEADLKAISSDYSAKLEAAKSPKAETSEAPAATEAAVTESTSAAAVESENKADAATPAATTPASTKKYVYTDKEYTSPASFTASGELGFFTKQLTGVKPGLYRVQVDVLDSDSKVTESIVNFVAVKEKPAESKVDIFETQQSGAMQFLSNLLKSIFK